MKHNLSKSSFILWIAALSLLAAPAFAQSDNCGLESQLITGEAGWVLPGDANNVRDEPARSGNLVGQIPGGHTFNALEGEGCASGFTWREVEFYQDGEWLTGWTVESSSSEYFLEPLPGVLIVGEGLSFVLPTGLADSAEIAYSPEQRTPRYVEIALQGYPHETEFSGPFIRIYTSDAFGDIDNMLGYAGVNAVEGLGGILADRPNLSEFGVISNRLPDNLPGAAASVLAFLDYHDFQNGRGYRFVTYYAQMLIGPHYNQMLYRYMGLTDDGKYFVSASFPIEAPDLPRPFDLDAAARDSDNGFARFERYAAANARFFESLPMEDYSPDLSLLDALIESLRINREIDLN